MKKVLALVVAFALCFTAFTGCFATSAAALDNFAVSSVEVAADAQAAAVTVSGTYTGKAVQLLSVTLPEGVALDSVEGAKELTDTQDGDYIVTGNVVKFLTVPNNAFTYILKVTFDANTSETDAVAYEVAAYVEYAFYDAENPTIETANAKGTITVAAVKVEEPEVPEKTFTAALDKVGGTTKFALNAYLSFAVSGFEPDAVKCLVFREAAFDAEAPINPAAAGWNIDFPTSGQSVTVSGFALAKITEKFVFVLYATDGDEVYYANPIQVAYADYLYGRITTEGVAAATVEKANKIMDTFYMIFGTPAYEGQAVPPTTFTSQGTYAAVVPTSSEDIGGGFESTCTFGGTTKYAVNITGDFANYTGSVKSYGIKVYRGAYVGDYTDTPAWDLSLGTNPALKLTVDGFANITERFIYIPYVIDNDDNVILGSATKISYVDYLVGRLNNATSEATQAKAAAILDMYELIYAEDIYTVA